MIKSNYNADHDEMGVKSKCCSLTVFLSKELGVDHMMNDGTEEEQKVRAEMTRGFKVNIV